MVIFLFSIFIAFAFGLILYFSIQEKIPDEVSFLKAGKGTPTRVMAPGATSSYKNWDIYQSKNNDEVKLVNSTTFVKQGNKEDPFIVSFNCAAGTLSSFIQHKPGLNFVKPDRSDTAVVFINGTKTTWAADPAFTDKYTAKEPKVVLAIYRKSPEVKVEYLKAGQKDPSLAVVKPEGLEELAKQFPTSCM